MMSMSGATSAFTSMVSLTPEALPRFQENEQDEIVDQIAAYLRHLLEIYQDCSLPAAWIELPKMFELAKHFQCSELDVLSVLQRLEKQGYCCYLRSLEGPLFLKDPLQRKPDNLARGKKLSQRLLKPLELLLPSSKSMQHPRCQETLTNRMDKS